MNKLSKNNILFICAIVIIVLLTSVVLACVSLFIKADEYSKQARLLNRAVIESSSIAETLKASGGDLHKAGQLMTEHRLFDVTENTLTLYYDENLNPASQSNIAHKAVIEKTALSDCCEYKITISGSDTGSDIYELSFKSIYTGGNTQ